MRLEKLPVRPLEGRPFDGAIGQHSLLMLTTLSEARRALHQAIPTLETHDCRAAFDCRTAVLAIDRLIVKEPTNP